MSSGEVVMQKKKQTKSTQIKKNRQSKKNAQGKNSVQEKKSTPMQKNLKRKKDVLRKDTPVSEVLKRAPPCSCSSCNHGCTMGSGFLAQNDFEPLAQFLGISVTELKKKYLERRMLFGKEHWRPRLLRKINPRTGKKMPFGKCIFFKNNKCSVHPAKPLECKIAMGCKPYGEQLTQWFMLNHLIDTNSPESMQEYASYLSAGGKTLPGGTLRELIPHAQKRKKMLNPEKEMPEVDKVT